MFRSTPDTRTGRPRLAAILALAAVATAVGCDARTEDETIPEAGEGAAEEEARTDSGEIAVEPSLSVSPDRGAPGSEVRVEAVGLPPNRRIRIGTGPENSEYEIIAETRSNAQGKVDATVSVPSWAEPGRRFVFVAETPDHGIKLLSDPFAVTEPGGSPDPGTEDETMGQIMDVSGVLTGEGVECQAFRADDGTLYTLVGDLGGFGDGDRVRLEGEAVEMSFCQQGTTLRVVRIERSGGDA